MIKVKNLTKYYGKRLALDDVSFSVSKGEIVGFLGPNGAGKTTTMRIITGFLTPTYGDVSVAGYDVLSNSLEARRHIGYLPEAVPLYTDMTVHSYLSFRSRLRGLSRSRSEARIDDVIGLCHLEEYADVIIGKLSKGFRQRVGIAQAIIHEPEVLILDEPTVGIDPIEVNATRQIIRELAKEHAVMLSTHILPEVSMTCQRVIIIHQGKIMAESRIEDLSAIVGGSKRVRLEVEGATKKILDCLHQVAGVTRVSYEDSRYIVEFPSEKDLRSVIIEAIGKGGFALFSLESVSLSLEDVFLKLTREETSE